jgi:hypothetical protein
VQREKWRTILLYFYVAIFGFGIILLFLNINIISVIHAKDSGGLPVVKYEIYLSTEVLVLYFVIGLALFNIICIKINILARIIPHISFLTPLISFVLILTLFLNPHFLIINPTGLPPTRLDALEIGGILVIVLFTSLTINGIMILWVERQIKRYVKILCIIIGALLLSEFIHESGHLFFALISGGTITAFFPFPIVIGGEFTAGYVGYTNVPINLVPLVLIGGEIFQWITICVIITLLYFKPQYRTNLFIIFLLFISFLDFPLYVINNSIGLPHWFLVGSTNGDIMIVSTLTGFPLWGFLILACSQLVIIGFIISILIFQSRRTMVNEATSLQ